MNHAFNKRENWIDWAKAICIYLMVAGHSNISSTFHGFIYLFHMPVFFIISGILFHDKKWMDLVKMTFIPMLFFNLVNYPYYIYKQITLFKNDLTTDIMVWKPVMGHFCNDSKYSKCIQGDISHIGNAPPIFIFCCKDAGRETTIPK